MVDGKDKVIKLVDGKDKVIKLVDGKDKDLIMIIKLVDGKDKDQDHLVIGKVVDLVQDIGMEVDHLQVVKDGNIVVLIKLEHGNLIQDIKIIDNKDVEKVMTL
jgi:hypothetical protein